MNAMSREWKIGDVVEGGASASCPVPTALRASWYVLQIFVGSEKVVSARLRRLATRWGMKIEIYCPMAKIEIPARLRRGKRIPSKTVERPAFAGYLFVSLADHRLFSRLDQVPSAIDFIRHEGAPIAVREAIIETIKVAEDIGGLDTTLPVVQLKVGDQVMVSGGPFSRFVGTIKTLPGTAVATCDADVHQATVALMLFGQETDCTLPLSDIEPV